MSAEREKAPMKSVVIESPKLGIEDGFEWRKAVEKTVAYTERGISSGMQLVIKAAEKENRIWKN